MFTREELIEAIILENLSERTKLILRKQYNVIKRADKKLDMADLMAKRFPSEARRVVPIRTRAARHKQVIRNIEISRRSRPHDRLPEEEK